MERKEVGEVTGSKKGAVAGNAKKKKEEFQTVGEASVALSKKNDGAYTVFDQAKESRKNIEVSFDKCIKDHKNLWDKDFYVVKFSRRDHLLWNVVDNRYMAHKNCPYPSFNQTVIKYIARTGNLEELWVLPAERDCIEMIHNKDLLECSETELYEYVLGFFNGKLKALAELNGAKKYMNEEIV